MTFDMMTERRGGKEGGKEEGKEVEREGGGFTGFVETIFLLFQFGEVRSSTDQWQLTGQPLALGGHSAISVADLKPIMHWILHYKI